MALKVKQKICKGTLDLLSPNSADLGLQKILPQVACGCLFFRTLEAEVGNHSNLGRKMKSSLFIDPKEKNPLHSAWCQTGYWCQKWPPCFPFCLHHQHLYGLYTTGIPDTEPIRNMNIITKNGMLRWSRHMIFPASGSPLYPLVCDRMPRKLRFWQIQIT